MKRFVISGCTLALLIGAAFVPGSASAQSAFNTNVGCGLGNVIIKEQDSVVYQVLAVTTNGTLGNQTFGISSGTLECQQPARFVYNEKVNRFVAENMDSLASEMAAGHGEALATLAELMDVPADKKSGFYASLQSNFEKIYSSGKIQSAEVIENISKVNF